MQDHSVSSDSMKYLVATLQHFVVPFLALAIVAFDDVPLFNPATVTVHLYSNNVAISPFPAW